MRLLSVVGTRPQLIKAAALQPVLARVHATTLVDTGQHWDERMARSFVDELGLTPPDHMLDAGGGTHAEQTARMLLGLEPLMTATQPDAVVVYGDTNSTLAGALSASKLGIPVAHVEAGLRSFDRRMPEEQNRVLVDHLAAWCFAPTPAAVRNLAAEGVTDGVEEVGDILQDLAAATVDLVRGEERIRPFGLATGGYLFATVHRAENREAGAVRRWLALLDAAARPDRPVVLAMHPGTAAVLAASGLAPGPDVRVIAPQGYRTTMALQLHAAAVLTDSGGIQRESAWLDVPCLVLRETSEWVEAVAQSRGRMRLVGTDASAARDALAELAPASAIAEARHRAATATVSASGACEQIASSLGRIAVSPA